jgi:hypothetical protein
MSMQQIRISQAHRISTRQPMLPGSKHSLQPRPPQNFLRIAGALDLDIGGLDLGQIVSGQRDGERAQILFQALEFARPEQGHDPRLLS